MTTKDEALKMAMEALEFIRRWGEPEEGVLKRDEAITAIRSALADSALERMAENERELGLDYMEPAPPPECKTEAEKTAFAFGWFKALETAREQPAIKQDLTPEQPEAQDREPCGWRWKYNGKWAYSFAEDAWDFIYAVSPAARKAARDNAPASKPWVHATTWRGLTDEDKLTILRMSWKTLENLIDNTESKLKEKNGF